MDQRTIELSKWEWADIQRIECLVRRLLVGQEALIDVWAAIRVVDYPLS
jgi:hypothetical protein